MYKVILAVLFDDGKWEGGHVVAFDATQDLSGWYPHCGTLESKLAHRALEHAKLTKLGATALGNPDPVGYAVLEVSLEG